MVAARAAVMETQAQRSAIAGVDRPSAPISLCVARGAGSDPFGIRPRSAQATAALTRRRLGPERQPASAQTVPVPERSTTPTPAVRTHRQAPPDRRNDG